MAIIDITTQSKKPTPKRWRNTFEAPRDHVLAMLVKNIGR
jgi:hypothetical protein